MLFDDDDSYIVWAQKSISGVCDRAWLFGVSWGLGLMVYQLNFFASRQSPPKNRGKERKVGIGTCDDDFLHAISLIKEETDLVIFTKRNELERFFNVLIVRKAASL